MFVKMSLTTIVAVLLALSIVRASAAEPSDYDGQYVGVPDDSQSGCKTITREFVVQVTDGQAFMVYNADAGTTFRGYVNGKGVVKMSFDVGPTQASFFGHIENGELKGESNSFGSVQCKITYDMKKRQ